VFQECLIYAHKHIVFFSHLTPVTHDRLCNALHTKMTRNTLFFLAIYFKHNRDFMFFYSETKKLQVPMISYFVIQ